MQYIGLDTRVNGDIRSISRRKKCKTRRYCTGHDTNGIAYLTGCCLVAQLDMLAGRHALLAADPGPNDLDLVAGFEEEPGLLFDRL